MTDDVARDFGDADPEDAWDDGDDDNTKLDILERVVESLRDCDDDRLEARRTDALRLVGKMEGARQARTVDSGRLADIRDELESL